MYRERGEIMNQEVDCVSLFCCLFACYIMNPDIFIYVYDL